MKQYAISLVDKGDCSLVERVESDGLDLSTEDGRNEFGKRFVDSLHSMKDFFIDETQGAYRKQIETLRTEEGT